MVEAVGGPEKSFFLASEKPRPISTSDILRSGHHHQTTNFAILSQASTQYNLVLSLKPSEVKQLKLDHSYSHSQNKPNTLQDIPAKQDFHLSE